MKKGLSCLISCFVLLVAFCFSGISSAESCWTANISSDYEGGDPYALKNPNNNQKSKLSLVKEAHAARVGCNCRKRYNGVHLKFSSVKKMFVNLNKCKNNHKVILKRFPIIQQMN